MRHDPFDECGARSAECEMPAPMLQIETEAQSEA